MKNKKFLSYFIHFSLFLFTFFTTTLAGVQWLNKNPLELSNFLFGLPYSLCLLAILSAHEFGHYFAAKFHNVETTLPFYIPIPPFFLNPFGTMGAVIRIKSPLRSKNELFDIGIAGPLAGLVITIIVIAYGIINLPEKSFLYSIHPEYLKMDSIPQNGLQFGNSLFFTALRQLAPQGSFFPPMNEIYHYPFLCVGWFGLFITAMNLIPVGQLDGGHILYSLIGEKQWLVARVFFGAILGMGVYGVYSTFKQLEYAGLVGWFVWALILFFVIKLDHPEIPDEVELDPSRKLLGWITFLLFILIFTPIPFTDF